MKQQIRFIQQKLGLTGKQKVYLLKCIRYDPNSGNDLPLLLTEIYLPCSLLPNLMDHDFETVSLYDVLLQCGLYPQEVIRYIEAQMPDARTAAILQMRRRNRFR